MRNSFKHETCWNRMRKEQRGSWLLCQWRAASNTSVVVHSNSSVEVWIKSCCRKWIVHLMIIRCDNSAAGDIIFIWTVAAAICDLLPFTTIVASWNIGFICLVVVDRCTHHVQIISENKKNCDCNNKGDYKDVLRGAVNTGLDNGTVPHTSSSIVIPTFRILSWMQDLFQVSWAPATLTHAESINVVRVCSCL